MPFPFPARSLSSTLADHLEDHNTIATILGTAPFTSNSSRDEHVDAHNVLHPDFGLPTRALGDSAALHLSDHQTIHPNLISTYAGPRGTVGQQPSASIPGYPSSFTVDNITDFPTLNNAVNAGGSGRKFHITGSFAFLGVIRPHAGDEFWGANGVTITRAAAISSAIQPTVATAGVKVMNLAFSGFNNGTGSGNGTAADSTVDALSSDSWEVGYCRFANTYAATKLGASTLGSRVHHCYYDATGGTFGAFQGRNHIFEDNEFANCLGDDGQKFVGTRGIAFRHNYAHGASRSACWFDTDNTEATVEWNVIEAIGNVTNGMGGVCFEACTYIDGSGSVKISESTKNRVRYNRFFNNVRHALGIYHSSWVEVYGNTFSQDAIQDSNVGSIDMQDSAPLKGQGICELKNNWIHNNFVVQTTTNRKAARLNTGGNVTDNTPYINNTMNNSFDSNVYDLASAAHTAFRWVGVDKTFAQWNTVPQGTNGTGAFQDVNGSFN